MKIKYLSYYIQKFLTHHLPYEKGLSSNTIDSYRYNFILFFEFMKEKHIHIDKIEISDITRSVIIEYLDWLEKTRKNSIVTRNSRLAAWCSFYRFLQYEYPDYMNQYNDILNIPIKKGSKTVISYIEIEGIKLLMEQPNKTFRKEHRDYLILLLLYETAVRVSELMMIKIGDFHMTKPFYLKVIGKGKKERLIPLPNIIIQELKNYIGLYMSNETGESLLFYNSRSEKLTRAGISYILEKYVARAKIENKNLYPNKVTPHILRHSKAMHLLQNDVNLIYIRDFLGHTTIQTTEIYARADSKRKREAIENAYQDIYPKEKAKWQNESILEWLKQF